MALNSIRVVLVVVAALIVGLLVFYAWALQKPHSTIMPNPTLPTKQITIGDSTIMAEVADTEASREKGLSGRAALGEGSGMLFVFDNAGEYGFWMKDMSFSLDIIFIDDTNTIVTINSNLSPLTYEQKQPEVFYPALPVRYVLELPAGYAKAHDIAVGAQVVVQ